MIIKCPVCNHEITGIECPVCGGSTPGEGTYCINCGRKLNDETAASVKEDDVDFDLDDRILCSDGTCTGIIIDGKCSECGKPPEQVV